MATHPSWSGYLKVSLVVCPVELFNATTHAETVSFHFINPKTQNRIQMKPYDPDSGVVERKSLVRGFEVAKGRYVTIDDEDLAGVQLESTKTVEVNRFVDIDEIDPIYFDTPYFVVPKGKAAAEPFGVIRDAMRKERKTALGQLVLAHREHAIAISPRGKGLLGFTLRDPRELRDEKAFFHDIPAAKAEAQMIDIATKIIEQQSGKFDPSRFEDRYETALREMIKRRARGAKPVAEAPKEPKPTNVVDLMSVLKASLKKSETPASRGKGKGKVVPLRKVQTERGTRRKSAAR